MRRRFSALNALHEKGYLVQETQSVRQGRNSEILLVKTQNKEYALKIFNDKKTFDGGSRFLNEIGFLKYAEESHIKNVPIVHEQCRKDGWALLDWIEGKPVRELTHGDIQMIADFIGEINSTDIKRRMKLQRAAESVQSLNSLCINLEKRKKYLEKISDGVNRENLGNLIENINNEIDFLNAKGDKPHWQSKYVGTFASQSDVGIHNMIRCTKGSIKFIDFEYAGRDDISKTIADIVVNPNYVFTRHQEETLIGRVKDKIEEGDDWIFRYQDIKRAIRLKWCILIHGRKNYSKKMLRYIKDTTK